MILNADDGIIDEVTDQYKGGRMPVADDDGNIVGSIWLHRNRSSLIVLDVVQPGALEMWDNLGRDVIFTGPIPDDPVFEIIVVSTLQECLGLL